MILHTHKGYYGISVARSQRFTHLPGGKIAAPHIADLTLLYKIIQCVQRFLNRSSRARMVEQVDIDIIHLKARQALVYLPQDVTTPTRTANSFDSFGRAGE